MGTPLSGFSLASQHNMSGEGRFWSLQKVCDTTFLKKVTDCTKWKRSCPFEVTSSKPPKNGNDRCHFHSRALCRGHMRTIVRILEGET